MQLKRVIGILVIAGIACVAIRKSVSLTDVAVSQFSKETSDQQNDLMTFSNDKKAWWMKRRDNHEPSEAQNEINLEKYDACYLGPESNKKGQKKVMYLTFDCGYENGYTETMLDILKEHKAKAVFFVTKHYITSSAPIVKRMKEEGHLVGNHTCSHPSMPEISLEKQEQEIKECAEIMKEETGYSMDKLFRPPKGEYSERTLQLVKSLGYRTIFWSIAYLDYDVNKQPGKEYVINHFKEYHHNRAIALIHNVSSSNAEALDEVLTYLEGAGYRFALPLTKQKNKS
ncbi:MAG: polysaccharide deacetylase family protein [Lachnospiraceae bacterium]